MDAAAQDRTARRDSVFRAREIRRLNPLYGMFVGIMKLLLPTAATLLIVLVAVWPQLDEQNRRFRIGPAEIDRDAARNLNMVNARYTGVDDERRPFTVTADAANQKAADSPLIELAQPKADIVMEDGSWLALTARDGIYDKNLQVLQLTGAVNLFHDKGYEFRTDSATFDLKVGDAHGVDPVQGQGPFGELAAQGFVIYNRGQRVVFTGKAKLTLKPEAMEKP